MQKISIIIPVYNEEKSIGPLHSAVKKTISRVTNSYELIFIDDGSTDNTFFILKKLKSKHKQIKLIKFKKNFGKAAALAAGFKLAKGDIIITMDGDLQDDPTEIPNFISKINEGYDLISGWKYDRKDPLSKKIASKIFNFLTRILTGVHLHDFNCGFKAYRRNVVKNLRLYGELHRYIPVLAYQKGFKLGEIKVKHHPRKYGKSKYGLSRLIKGSFDLITVKFITSYTKRPLHLFGVFGLLFLFLGIILNLYLIYLKIVSGNIGNRPLLFLAVLLIILSVQFIAIGLLGEMITYQNKEEPYLIEEILK